MEAHTDVNLSVAEEPSKVLAPVLVSRLALSNSTHEVTPSPQQDNLEVDVVLRLECVSAASWKKFLVCQFFLRWGCLLAWLAAFGSVWAQQAGAQNRTLLLIISAVVGSLCSLLLVVTLIKYVHSIIKAASVHKTWSQTRRRLVFLNMMQMQSLVIINALQIASGLQGNKNSACNIFTNGCKWSYFLQWSAWNVVLVMQLVLTHAASVWTDKEGHTSRRLLMQRASWRTEQHKSALILEAPWMVHLPKLGIWLFMQATLVVQLVDALSGHAYSQHQVTDCLQAQPSCKQTDVFRVMNILRMVILGLYFVWHIMLLRHGWRDMQSTPYQAFR
ncbi:TPA: hypothetical protein ACH3X3_012132 [Trebouxia sp. C0006]